MSLKTLVGSGSGSGSEKKKKFGSGSGINHSGSATLPCIDIPRLKRDINIDGMNIPSGIYGVKEILINQSYS